MATASRQLPDPAALQAAAEIAARKILGDIFNIEQFYNSVEEILDAAGALPPLPHDNHSDPNEVRFAREYAAVDARTAIVQEVGERFARALRESGELARALMRAVEGTPTIGTYAAPVDPDAN